MSDSPPVSPVLTGIHHITAIAADPQPNLDFYAGVLGLRFVKRTVNFDDPGTYHFYYGDRTGTPGTILTFFPWPGAGRGRIGNGQVTTTTFAIPGSSLDYWHERLSSFGVTVESETERFGQLVMKFSDPDGLALEFAATSDLPETRWDGSSVPADHTIAGFNAATLSEEGYEKTASLLTEILGFRMAAQDGNRYRYQAAGDNPAATVDVVCAPDGRHGLNGAGTVHHIAWRTPNDANQALWRAKLANAGYNVTPIVDRNYFKSIYFREPGGVLFEIATDSPGFTIDEPIDQLGESLKLPEEYQAVRDRIERVLPRIAVPVSRHLKP